ncbi:hypothetical protein BD413DRAFT_313185 [Trametes elegans]|nr:hypothetical protein BD413DRAFT_313185 [Trametes elegans]
MVSLGPKSLLDLPPELIVEVLKLLDHCELMRCRRVCSTLNSLIDTNICLQYQVELEVEGLRDGDERTLCASERLKLLRARRDRWLTLDWCHVVSLPPQEIIPEASLPYELQGGIFLNIRNHAGRITINSTTLPTTDYPRTDHANSHVLQAQVLDITTDPTQDLLVMLDICGRVHLWSLSTFAAHPRAAKPILCPQGANNLVITTLYIAHDLLALLKCSDAMHITIWNWQTGSKIFHLEDSDASSYVATSLAWLSSRTFVLADIASGDLFVFSLRDYICNTRDAPLNECKVTPCARLQLPRVDSDWHISDFQVDTTPLQAELPRGRPFALSPELNIIVFSVQYVALNRRPSRYVGFVHNHYLLSYVRSRDEGGATKTVPWAEWGPHNCRFIPRRIGGPPYARHVYGQKVVYNWIETLVHRQLITVYDFNVHPMRLASAQRAQGGVMLIWSELELLRSDSGRGEGEDAPAPVCLELVDWPTVIRRDSQTERQYHPFEEDVVSALPYVETSRFVDGRAERGAQFMMDEERLIELRWNEDGGPSQESVRVYTM